MECLVRVSDFCMNNLLHGRMNLYSLVLKIFYGSEVEELGVAKLWYQFLWLQCGETEWNKEVCHEVIQ